MFYTTTPTPEMRQTVPPVQRLLHQITHPQILSRGIRCSSSRCQGATYGTKAFLHVCDHVSARRDPQSSPSTPSHRRGDLQQMLRCSAVGRSLAANEVSPVPPASAGTTTAATALAASAVASAAAAGLRPLRPSTHPTAGASVAPPPPPPAGAAGATSPAATPPSTSRTHPAPRQSNSSPSTPHSTTSHAAAPPAFSPPSNASASASTTATAPTTSPPSSPTSSTPSPAPSATTSPASSPSPTAPSAPLEGTPVPWATLGPSLDLIQQRFRVGPATFRLVAPRDVDAVMDMYLDKGLLDSDPYWTRAWPSAIALAATLLQRPELVRGKVVADLGAGLGLAGMAAAMAGAREVVLLDREPLALQCALLSAAATGLDAAPSTRPAGSVRHRIQPLPADQLPSYGTLQLTPPYKQQCSAPPAAAAPAPSPSVASSSLDPAAGSDASQSEWELLLALARRLSAADGPAAAATTTSSPSLSGGAGDANMIAEVGPGDCGAVGDGDRDGDRDGDGGEVDAPDVVGVFRAHVFDWTAPPEMDQLLPPEHTECGGGGGGDSVTGPTTPHITVAARGVTDSGSQRQQQQQQQHRNPLPLRRQRQRRFDVVLACDVLYEDAAVGPIAALLPVLLEPAGGRLLLADPPNRTVRNRERFLQELKSGPLRLAVEECSLQQCEVSKLDNEMAGGLAGKAETVPVQFLVFRSCVGNDTVGVKL